MASSNVTFNRYGERLVWSIHDNAYVTEGYWAFINAAVDADKEV